MYKIVASRLKQKASMYLLTILQAYPLHQHICQSYQMKLSSYAVEAIFQCSPHPQDAQIIQFLLSKIFFDELLSLKLYAGDFPCHIDSLQLCLIMSPKFQQGLKHCQIIGSGINAINLLLFLFLLLLLLFFYHSSIFSTF